MNDERKLLHRSSFLLHRLLTEFLHALLTRDGLTRTFAGAGVRACALAANQKRAAMTVTAIAADLAQTRDVLLNRAAQSTFDQHVLVQDADDLGQLCFAH